MAFVTAETRKKVDQIVENMENYAVLADDRNPSAQVPGLDCTPGMGMPSDAKNFRKLASDVNDGLFKILVMGKFKNGKSTFVNAIVSKSMMAAKATATTAVIATVGYGEDEDNVDVFYTDPKKNTRMSLERFNKEFALTPEDQETIEGGGNCDRFADVEYVKMRSKDELFRDGVTLIDSPGLEEANSRTRTTSEYVPRANAIIFTLTATALFSAQERAYIMENFAGKHLRNVFFVVNRIDNLNEGELESNVIPSVRKGLASVFTNEAGEFDEHLYNRRVFFTNAYGALQVRTGRPYKIGSITVPITIEDTGILKFEAALRDFLSSDERISATFQSTLTGMANTYQRAKDKTESEKAARLQPLSELEKNVQLAEREIQKAEAEVDNMRKAIKSTAQLVAQKVYTDLITFARTKIPEEFSSVVENDTDVKFGIKEMIIMAKNAVIGGDQGAVVQPLVNKIEGYITSQLETWAKSVPIQTAADFERLQADLNASMDSFSINMEDAMRKFSGGDLVNEDVGAGKGAGTKAAQAAIAVLGFGDASVLVDVAAGGGMEWGDFIKKLCTQLVVQTFVAIVAGPLALPALIITEALQIKKSGEKNGKRILNQLGGKAFARVADEIQEQEMAFKTKIEDQFVDQCEVMLIAAKNLVDDTRASQKRIVEEHSKGAEYAAAENARQDKVLAAMFGCVGNVYELMYGSRPSESEVAKLAASPKKVNA